MNKNIILDTNIVSYMAQENTKSQFVEKRHQLSNQHYQFGISQMTFYEVLRTIDPKNFQQSLELLNRFKKYEITGEIIIFSTIFYGFYKKLDSKKKKDKKKWQDADIIIGVTAFLNESYILTANRRDFPYPYFIEKEVTPILYQRNVHSTGGILVYLLEPDIQLIQKKTKERLLEIKSTQANAS